MRKTVLILGMILALTFTGAIAQNENTTRWTVTHFCVHDSQDESLMENDELAPYVLTITPKEETGDYGTITVGDNKQNLDLPLLQSDGQGYVLYLTERGPSGNGSFCFKGIDQDGAESYICVQLSQLKTGDYVIYLGVRQGNRILYWTAKRIKPIPQIET